MNIRLLVVDDHEMRMGLRYALGVTEMEIVNATQVVEAVRIALAAGNDWTAAQSRHRINGGAA